MTKFKVVRYWDTYPDGVIATCDTEEEAEKKVVAAQAEAEANRLRTQALTPMILKQQWIEKWKGDIPTVITGGNGSVFLDVSKMGNK